MLITLQNQPPTTWIAGSPQPIPGKITGIKWPDGSTECRFRLQHTAGSLVAINGEIGQVLTDPASECTTCSGACSG